MDLDLPCKNVDLQTGGFWRPVWTWGGGYFPVDIQKHIPAAEALKNGKPGWLFSIPFQDAMGLRWMLDSTQRAYGAVINLNPACFGGVYWVSGTVGGVYMAFAVWLPYARWVESALPIAVHFRPNYDLNKFGFGEAVQGASTQGVPVVLARDRTLAQPFLSAAWYYFLGGIAFVQQMLAVQRLAALVMPISPPVTMTTRSFLHPEAFFQDFGRIITCVVNQAVQLANSTGAGAVDVRDDYFIFSANSQGGVYLMHAANRPTQLRPVREIWMFDTNRPTMQDAKNMKGDILRRLYVAQSVNRDQLLTGGQGSQYERQTAEWSAVDISGIPNMGTNLHDYCGRFCFSHAVALSPAVAPLKQDSQLLNKTFQDPRCWPDRQEFWRKR